MCSPSPSVSSQVCAIQQQGYVADHSDGLPASLTVLSSILSRDVQRILENELGRLKADAVLALVPLVLFFVP
jgi:hypothetical protein